MKIDFPGLLFPRRCPICHEIVEDPGELACDICRTRLHRVRTPCASVAENLWLLMSRSIAETAAGNSMNFTKVGSLCL